MDITPIPRYGAAQTHSVFSEPDFHNQRELIRKVHCRGLTLRPTAIRFAWSDHGPLNTELEKLAIVRNTLEDSLSFNSNNVCFDARPAEDDT
jgi:hypothetical protein